MPELFQPPEIQFTGGVLVLRGWEVAAIEGLLDGEVSGRWDSRMEGWVCDAQHWARIGEALEAGGYARPSHEWPPVVWKPGPGHKRILRENQKAAVASWEAAGRRGVIVMPTGTGKTEVALEIMRRQPVSTLVVAPVRDLMYQWHRRIQEALGFDAGIIGDSVFKVRPVSVTTYDSAAIHMQRFGDKFQLVVWDECHHLPGPTMGDSARMSMAPWRLGLTATPERADGRHALLQSLIGPQVYDLPLAEVKNSVLADFEIRRIPVHLSEQERARFVALGSVISTYMQWRGEEKLSMAWEDVCLDARNSPEARAAVKAMRARKAIEDRAADKLRVIEDLFRLHPAEPCIIFAGSNQMARDVSEKFLIPCLLSHCGKKERADLLGGMEEGRYKALVANRVLDEGVDLPAAKLAIVIGGMASTRQAKQRLGRILRRKGNIKATLYEVVCGETGEVGRSRARRKSDAYAGTRHHRLRSDARASG